MKKRNNPISFFVWLAIIIGMIFIIKADSDNNSKENTISNEIVQKTETKKSNSNNSKNITKKSSKKNTNENAQSATVYVTSTGSKYHNYWCSYLKRSKIPISLSDAKSQGYTPCSRCKP